MIIESLVGLVLMISGGGEKSVDPTSAIIKGIKEYKEENEQLRARVGKVPRKKEIVLCR